MNREVIIIIILLGLSFLLWATLNWMTNSLYFANPQYDLLQNQIHEFHNENMQLHDEFLEDSSYTKIASEAASEGFIPAPFVTP